MSNLRRRAARTLQVSAIVAVVAFGAGLPFVYSDAPHAWIGTMISGWVSVLAVLTFIVALVLYVVARMRERAPSRPGGQRSTSEELERITALHSAGALTDAEFSAAKAKLIG